MPSSLVANICWTTQNYMTEENAVHREQCESLKSKEELVFLFQDAVYYVLLYLADVL
jgi:hypothetical protein